MANSNTTTARGFAAMKRNEVQKIAKKGGEASTGKFGSKNGADPSEAGKAGAAAQPVEAKREGGRNSRRTS